METDSPRLKKNEIDLANKVNMLTVDDLTAATKLFSIASMYSAGGETADMM